MTKTHSQGVNIDVKRFTNNLTFDIICDVGFGHQSNSQLDEFSQFVVTFRESVDAFVNAKKVFVQKYFPFIQYLPFGFGTTLKHQSEDVLKQVRELADSERRFLQTVCKILGVKWKTMRCFFSIVIV